MVNVDTLSLEKLSLSSSATATDDSLLAGKSGYSGVASQLPSPSLAPALVLPNGTHKAHKAAYETRRFFSLPDPPSGLVSPVSSPTRGSRELGILQGGIITQIHNCRVLRNHTLTYDDVWFQDGKIINPTSLYGLRGADVRIDGKGLIVAPGLIDVQLNGAFGYDFSFNREDIDQCMDVVSRGVLLQGCTAFCPTTVSSMPETYHAVIPHLGPRRGSLVNGAESLGAHIEGPFMNPKKKGAHELACLRAAPRGLADFDQCYGLENLRRHVAYITVAPEMPGVLETIPELIRECNVGISMGHTTASGETARRAHQSGAHMITHLFNAMTDFHHRDPGVIGLLGAADKQALDANGVAGASAPNTFYGLICDGIHVHPNTVKIAYRAHPAGAILVTDAMGAMGLPDGQYKLGNMSVDVKPMEDVKDGPRAAVIQGTSTLAGSIVTLIECVRNFHKFTQCSVVEAIEAATLHPALMLGIADRKGSLAFGCDADIVLLTDDLHVDSVFVRGELATPATVDFKGPSGPK
ncbi:N-acetyl-glucosamine-6-phosphate deacetylase [Linderina pennispora]|nr:N-acetyl-glucosamine-6-phosphate deacetylase [Linderina pennispora]